MLRVWVLVAILLTFLVPAKAATTVYGVGVFAQSGTVTNSAAALGVADGLTAAIARNSSLTLLLGLAATGANVTVTGVRSGPGGTVSVALGAVVAGVPVFTAGQTFPGAGGTATFDFSAGCAAISSSGCTLMRVGVAGGPPFLTFGLDGVSGVSVAPEPEAALLLLLAGLGVGLRLKAVRRGRLARA